MSARLTAADLDIDWNWYGEPPIWLSGFKKALVRQWLNDFGTKCPECSRGMVHGRKHINRNTYATIDHITPRSLGGTNELSNPRVICSRCNTRKGSALI